MCMKLKFYKIYYSLHSDTLQCILTSQPHNFRTNNTMTTLKISCDRVNQIGCFYHTASGMTISSSETTGLQIWPKWLHLPDYQQKMNFLTTTTIGGTPKAPMNTTLHLLHIGSKTAVKIPHQGMSSIFNHWYLIIITSLVILLTTFSRLAAIIIFQIFIFQNSISPGHHNQSKALTKMCISERFMTMFPWWTGIQ
jgi:hypothetical protein